jgi:hypothetical protein
MNSVRGAYVISDTDAYFNTNTAFSKYAEKIMQAFFFNNII